MKRTGLVVTLSILGILGAAATLVWAFLPEPPPATVDDVYGALMAVDPSTLSDEEVAPHIEKVGAVFRRLPPHEYDALADRTVEDDEFGKRMRSLMRRARELEGDGEERLPRLLPPEQRVKLMLSAMEKTVEVLEALPPDMREEFLEERRRAREGSDKGGPRGGGMTKDRLMQRRSQSTPTQRARFHQVRQRFRAAMGGR